MNNAEKTAKEIDRTLKEWCDGYCLIAFDALSGEPIMALDARDCKTEMALNAAVGGFLAQGGIGAMKARMKAAAEAQQQPPPPTPEE